MEHEMEFSDNVTILTRGTKTFYVVGTAHISQKSVEEVREVIEKVKPAAVCVELCETRYKTLMEENHWKKLNIVDVIKQGKALMLLASLALSSFQRKMGEKMGVKPGAELHEGVKAAKDVGAELVLADRDIQTTLKRTWGNLSFWKKMMVFGGLTESVLFSEDISEEELEKMKERDTLTDMMEEFAKALPDVKEPLIDERDQFLMSKIEEAPGDKVVAVVGAGHVAGMKNWFGKTVDREQISKIPPPSKTFQILKWVIPAIVLSLFVYGYRQHQGESFEDMLWAWVLPNAIGAALFTLIARAKFLTVIATAIAAPLTSLNPTIGAGMVAGFVEALLRKPTVEDCENIPEDIKSFKGFITNPFTRVLLVFMMANFGSMIGTYVGIGWLATLIGQS